jgi:hypothetical protein
MTPALSQKLKVCVVQEGQIAPRTSEKCVLGKHVKFDTRALESYCFEDWRPFQFMNLSTGTLMR